MLRHFCSIIIHSVVMFLHIHPSAVRFFSQFLKRKGVTAVGNFSLAQNVFNQNNVWVSLRLTAVYKSVDTKTASMFLRLKIRFCVLINYSITIT